MRITTTRIHMVYIRYFLIITCVSFTLSYLWSQVTENINIDNEKLIQKALIDASKDYRNAEIYRKVTRLPKDVKYILFWTQYQNAPFYYFKYGQRTFIEQNCSIINCYVTSNRHFFNGSLTRFDAIGFNGRDIVNMNSKHLPQERSIIQKYIYFNLESADNYPVCSKIYDDFFNWTSTYQLYSDIPSPYVAVKNIKGEIVGPKLNMEWEDMDWSDKEFGLHSNNWHIKRKAVAWFVSHCKSRSGRMAFAKRLSKELTFYGKTLDIYGECGPLKCPRFDEDNCNEILDRDYYFYLSFENSFSEDYVTEKLLTALQHNVVPIVFGGANYSRFLPPGSYLDATKMTPKLLANTIHNAMKSPKLYNNFYRWKSHYQYYSPAFTDNVCSLCAFLNNKTVFEEQSSYINFRSWWNPKYKQRCKK